ncbi:MAG: CPBP family intramembrane metalloprotease [Leptolyngbya sp. UWPOB_LEPTO1]|uniref:CPBP family intramembrane glutamic endopeptidase n=1 Tax=Leptolyngbya sp. UWPOB_LEPTO1 TaxID=2815653 RepID=UPI001AC21AEC|nr:type II CAAX endopeptidase family protein [Leptolyngbya sp. UWPOB_LEPTO1]MBN8564986.1 CPBP family intramembrane metalloprotease [Leptolyngbya sp. UWPOB_LEPTO1]
MSNHYVDAVRQGKNEWWRYLLGMILILGIGVVGGSALAAIGMIILITVTHPSNASKILDSPTVIDDLPKYLQSFPILNFIIHNLPFVLLFLGIVLAVKFVHQRRCRSLISPDSSFQTDRFFTGFGLWSILMLIALGVGYVISPQSFRLTFSPLLWVQLLVVVLVLTPIQIAAEELFCRGYLMQGLSLLTRNRWILICVPSLLFAIAHFGNSEMQRDAVWMALQYWSFGVFLAVVTLKDNRLELALGIHAAQNMVLLLLANTEDSALPTPSIFTQPQPEEARSSLFVFWLLAASFYWLIFGRKVKR